jgi:hypothetical protein
MHGNVPVRFGRGRLDSLGHRGLAAYLIGYANAWTSRSAPIREHGFASALCCTHRADRADASAAERLLGSHDVFQKGAWSGVGVGADARHGRAASATRSSGRAPQNRCDLWGWRRQEACSHGSLRRQDECENLSHTRRGTTVLRPIKQKWAGFDCPLATRSNGSFNGW